MTRSLLQQALELAMRCPWSEDRAKLADALRSALAAPMPEPVAWVRPRGGSDSIQWADGHVVFASAGRSPMHRFVDAGWTPLYATPPAAPAPVVPIDMVLHCPKCGKQHIDAADPWVAKYGEEVCKTRGFDLWTNPPHKSHLCRREDGGCGHIWRPADVPTNGVAALRTKGKSDMPPALAVSEKATVDCVTTIEVLRARIAMLESAAPVVPLTAQPVAWAKQEKKRLRITHIDMQGEHGWQPLVFGAAVLSAAPVVPTDAALNALARLFHNGEEIESDDGAAMAVDLSLWHEAAEAFDSLIGEGDGETLASSAAPVVREPICRDAILGAVARGWCAPANAHKVMGFDLAIDIAREVESLLIAAPVVREPLTREAIDAIWNGMGSFTDRQSDWRLFARAIERAHGITGGGK